MIRGADCHAHVFDPQRYPYSAEPGYHTEPPGPLTAEDFMAAFESQGLSHGLAVGPVPYGSDNRCLLDAIARSAGRLKGIALVEPDVPEAEIARLKQGGVVGVRINVFHYGAASISSRDGQRLTAKIREAGWFCQIQYEKDQLAEIVGALIKSQMKILIDHCGRPDPSRGLAQPGFQALLELGRSTDAVVKLSGPFRYSNEPFPYRDTDPFVAALIEAFTLERCIWGSDWPFVRMQNRLDYAAVFACLHRWLPEEGARDKVLRANPARLFGFRQRNSR